MSDLDVLDVGMVYDLMIESGNDSEEYETYQVATQSDFDKF